MQAATIKPETETINGALGIAGEKSCVKCAHIEVCGVFRAIAPLLSNEWTDKDRPFQPEQLATICQKFFGKGILETLQ